MKLIAELIDFALLHDTLNEEHKRKLQDDGFYKFYYKLVDDYSSYEYDYDDEYDYDRESFENDYEEQLDRTYYDDYYHPGKRYGRRHHGGGGKSHKKIELEYLDYLDLEKRVQAAFKRWNKSLEPLVQTVSFLTNHGMNAQGRDLSTWQNASNWLFEVNKKKLFEAVTKLGITHIIKFTHLCSGLTWHKLQELLVEPIRHCNGWYVTTYKELIQVTNEALSEDAENMIQNELFAQVYRLAAGWSKIC